MKHNPDIGFDTDKIDEVVLALLSLTLNANRNPNSAWKSHDWDALDRLHEKGLILDPHNKNKSVVLTDEGLAAAKELSRKYFTP